MKEQLGELEAETFHIEGEYKAQFGMATSFDLHPGTLIAMLDNDIAHAKVAVGDLKRDLLGLKDVQAVKAWLRKLR